MLIPPALQVNAADSVATALRDLAAGEAACGVVLRDAVARGHKLAVRAHATGDPVVKLGFPIGRATQPIAAGAHVHSHNLAPALAGEAVYRFIPVAPRTAATTSTPTFQGFMRSDGRVATRNEIWVLPTVGCVARTAQKIAAAGGARHAGRIDGVHAFAHPFGCSQLGEDLAGTRALLAALACHPNAGGVLLVGLGCESNQLDALLAEIDPIAQSHIRILRAQASGDELAEGATLTDVVGYGGQARAPGLTLLEAPGNDAVSSTALAAAGATLILFTTGRGTPLGFPVPTLKIASNTALATRKPGWIDFDAGTVLEVGQDTAADALLARIIATASGEPTAAEKNDEREIAIWKRGVTL